MLFSVLLTALHRMSSVVIRVVCNTNAIHKWSTCMCLRCKILVAVKLKVSDVWGILFVATTRYSPLLLDIG